MNPIQPIRDPKIASRDLNLNTEAIPQELPPLGKIQDEMMKLRTKEEHADKVKNKIKNVKEFVFLHLAKFGLGTATASALVVPGSILLAGALGVFIGSNPVGWAIGVAAVAGGLIALTAASIAIFRGKDLHPGEILAPIGNGVIVACIALIVVLVIAAAVGGGGRFDAGGGFGGGGHGFGSMGFMNGVFFYHCLHHHTYPNSLLDCDFSSKEKVPTETLQPEEAKEKLQNVIEENLTPRIAANADHELEKISKEGFQALKEIGVVRESTTVLNDEQLEKAYQHAAYLVRQEEFDKALKILSLLHRQFPDHSELSKELALISLRGKNPPYNLAAKFQIEMMKKEEDPLFVKNLAFCLDKLNLRQEAKQILGYRYLISKNEPKERHDEKNHVFQIQAERLLLEFNS